MEITKEKFGETKVKKMNENSPASSNSSSSSSTPSSNFTFEGDLLPINLPSHKWFAFQVEDITKKIHDLMAQYNASVVCLQQVFDEMNLLQEDNLNLKAQTIDLEFLISATEIEVFSNLRSIPATVNQISDEKMTKKKKKTDVVPRGAVVPKISVRSKTVSAMNKIINNQTAAGDSNSFNNAPATTGSKPPHRLRLKDVEQGEEIELEVYKQGMTKTELCNKWEETGVCPYGERCQFAHGVQELRPVIRHPKYKTTLCRMITNGGTCPYGHRCHFRHAIDPNEEKEVVL